MLGGTVGLANWGTHLPKGNPLGTLVGGTVASLFVGGSTFCLGKTLAKIPDKSVLE